MHFNFKKVNVIMVYLLFLVDTYLSLGSLSTGDLINTFFGTAFLFFVVAWMKIDASMAIIRPFFDSVKYVIFGVMSLLLGIIVFILGYTQITFIQYVGYMITLPPAYYLVDKAFNEPDKA
jgi:hypothetical protein